MFWQGCQTEVVWMFVSYPAKKDINDKMVLIVDTFLQIFRLWVNFNLSHSYKTLNLCFGLISVLNACMLIPSILGYCCKVKYKCNTVFIFFYFCFYVMPFDINRIWLTGKVILFKYYIKLSMLVHQNRNFMHSLF